MVKAMLTIEEKFMTKKELEQFEKINGLSLADRNRLQRYIDAAAYTQLSPDQWEKANALGVKCFLEEKRRGGKA